MFDRERLFVVDRSKYQILKLYVKVVFRPDRSSTDFQQLAQRSLSLYSHDRPIGHNQDKNRVGLRLLE